MQTEIEAKWLRANFDEIRKRLNEIGATLIQQERSMVRKNFDYEDEKLEKIGGWVRVRNEGDKATLSYKQLNDRTIHGTKEVTVVVDDFSSSCDFLEAIGLVNKSVQETKRESWEYDGAEIELDTWPWIPKFVEIEAKDEDKLHKVAKKLGLDINKALHGSVETAYQDIYDVTEQEIDSWQEIKFGPVPDWLELKRR